MRYLGRFLFTLLLLCGVGLLTAARADEIVTTGTFTGTTFGVDHPYSINFSGANFSVSVNAEPFIAQTPCAQSMFCAPGNFIRANGTAFLGGGAPIGTVVFNGITYSPARLLSSTLVFASPQVAIPLSTDPTIFVMTPFTMTGLIRGGLAGQPGELFNFNVSGEGTATFTLERAPNGNYTITSITYNFAPAPIPEPATLLLLGTGLAGVGAAVRRRRAVRRDNDA